MHPCLLIMVAAILVGCSHLADDGLPAPQTGEHYLHAQFARARARMDEPYILAGEDTLLLSRTFSCQLRRLGDARFAHALSQEPRDIISAVGHFVQASPPEIPHPQTHAVLERVPSIRFPAVRVTEEDAARQ